MRSEPILLPSLDSEIRIAFDRILELAGVRPIILAEVDDMAMLRLLARDSDGLTLVPPIVVRDELAAGLLVEVRPISNLSERFYAIAQMGGAISAGGSWVIQGADKATCRPPQ